MAQERFPPERPFGRSEGEGDDGPAPRPLRAVEREGAVPAVGEPPAAQDPPALAGPDDAAA